MAISNFDKKLEILDFLVFQYSKLIRLAVMLEQEGLDTKDVRKRERAAMKLIDKLRGDMLRTWNGQAATVMKSLRDVNRTAQRKVRELKTVVDKVSKVADILKVLDRGIKVIGAL